MISDLKQQHPDVLTQNHRATKRPWALFFKLRADQREQGLCVQADDLERMTEAFENGLTLKISNKRACYQYFRDESEARKESA